MDDDKDLLFLHLTFAAIQRLTAQTEEANIMFLMSMCLMKFLATGGAINTKRLAELHGLESFRGMLRTVRKAPILLSQSAIGKAFLDRRGPLWDILSEFPVKVTDDADAEYPFFLQPIKNCVVT